MNLKYNIKYGVLCLNERELRPLMQINDNYEKVILSMDKRMANFLGVLRMRMW